MKTTFKPCSNNKLNEYATSQLAIYSRFLELKDSFCEVIKKFNGKVINKRFLTALENISPKHEYNDITLSDFHFNFSTYGNELTITFVGYANNKLVRYSSEYHNQFTIYNYTNNRELVSHINGKRLSADEYLLLVEHAFAIINKRIEDLIDMVEHYDEVSVVYKQAYDLLRSVKDYREVCSYANSKEEPHLHYLKDVFIFN